ncbi:MAG: hypothetical protein R3185_01445 [Candidatus Thermoplasmatota archaeon]|nr:hypothetical protein [Candidatus Thermoplasmatota archaeon]
MARFLREIPGEWARQALVNKTLNASYLEEVRDEPTPNVDPETLETLARDVAVPELVPWEYAYVDVLEKDGRFFVAINHRYYRRSKSKTLDPEAPA